MQQINRDDHPLIDEDQCPIFGFQKLDTVKKFHNPTTLDPQPKRLYQ